MPIGINTILGWCRVANANRADVSNMLMPGGLAELSEFSTDEVKEAVKSFTRLPANAFMLTPHTMKRLVQLTLWVKDQRRLDEDAEFPNGTTQAQFVVEVETAQQRDKIRKERQKSAENLASVRIEPALKTSAGWEVWAVALETALKLAYGSKGVPLSYVIRTEETPNLIGHATWEEMAIHGAPLTGLDWEADRMTVHLFILNNIGQDSDAYTYIQPLLRRNDGRRDIIALRERYDNDATVQTRVNEANKTWELLVYKNERAMSFEEFCKKFQNALQHFERAGRAKHAGDVIDWIWGHIQNPELSQTLAALKASQSLSIRTPMQILQEVAKEVPLLSKGNSFQQRVSEIQVGGSDYTFEGETPSSGAFNQGGKLFCGSYSHNHWFGEDMSEYRHKILEIRDRHPEFRKGGDGGRGGNNRGNSHRRNQANKAKLKIKALQKSNEKLQVKLSALKTDQEDDDTDADESHTNAGDSFGGRASMRKPT